METMTKDERLREIERITNEIDRLYEERKSLCVGLRWYEMPLTCRTVAAMAYMREHGCSARAAIDAVREHFDAQVTP